MEYFRTLCEHIQRLVYVEVVVVVVVGVTTVLKAMSNELMWKAAYFKELWRQQWDCVNGELGYRLCGVLGSIKFINDKHCAASGVAPY